MLSIKFKLVALPFQTKGEEGCEALSSYSRTGPRSPSSADTLQCSAPITQPCDTGSPCMSASTNFWHAASKEKRVEMAHVHEARAERIIKFYAAARKITFCIAFPPCSSHLEHENSPFQGPH